MTEATETLIRRQVREPRAKLRDLDRRLDRVGARSATLERPMIDVQEPVAPAVGLAVSSYARYETNGGRIDRLTETVEALRARVEKLEEKA